MTSEVPRDPSAQECRPQFEVIPLRDIAEQVAEHLPPGSRVTVTASPAHGTAATISTALALAERGFTAIPHLAARQIADVRELRGILAELASAGVHEVFVIAGDAPRPAGAFTGALDLVEVIDAERRGFTIGVGAHPEGHPFVGEQEALRLLKAKAEHASYLVTQMCFEAAPLLSWLQNIRDAGVTLPVRPGIAAPVGTARLLRIGARIGVGRSLRLLTAPTSGVRRLVGPGSWRPDALLDELAPAYRDPTSMLQGPHVYTFNDLAATGSWGIGSRVAE
ncbi:methylenetetrahydrofolate reductase [Brachybacterium sp. FME24]|uniref:methylenetetrahydrofolate reductase n=1 Tax=Brachybacterium sp. FME24 TaxID=2742605 RepID=UPI001868DF57|nr:methylenetetrahydrofolate reductase [Brachybacterium sp. FME24]